MMRDVLRTARQSMKGALESAGFAVRRIPRRPEPLSRDGILGLYQTPVGRLWVPLDAEQDVIVDTIAGGGVFEPEVLAVASRFARPGTAIVDAGASFGQMTCAFSRIVGASGVVHSIEANPFSAELLRRNVAENGLSNVVVHERAVHERSGIELRLADVDFRRFGSYGSYGLEPGGSGIAVTSVAIDDLDLGAPLSFIKVDVQGADLAALKGARVRLTESGAAVIFEFEQQFQAEFGTCFQDYVELVQTAGYRFVEVVLEINYVIVPAASSVRSDAR